MNFTQTLEKQSIGLLKRIPLPLWATLASAITILLILVLVCCFCCCRWCLCCARVRSALAFIGKKIAKFARKFCCSCCGPENRGHLDLNKVQLTGQTVHERVRPSFDEFEYTKFVPNDVNQGIPVGEVRFAVEYKHNEEALEVTIFEARNLPSADEGGASDPYVRVMLLPDTKRRYETIVIDDTLDPVYNQTFRFNKLTHSELQNRTLSIRALDYDEFPGHDILGETLIPIIDINTQHRFEEWRILVPAYDESRPGELRKAISEYGDICVGLHYRPATKKLIVYVVECSNLKPVDEGSGGSAPTSDPFVKVTLFKNKKKAKTHKTRHIKQTLRPYYNEHFEFTLSPQDVPVADVRFLVLDYDIFGGADVIGQVVIGSSAYGPQRRHWRDTLISPKRPITCWHMLRSKPQPGEED